MLLNPLLLATPVTPNFHSLATGTGPQPERSAKLHAIDRSPHPG